MSGLYPKKYVNELLNSIHFLPAVEYCLHLPRNEMDTYDVDTEVLDYCHDVSHDILIIPDTAPFLEMIVSDATLIIFADNCLQETKELVQRQNTNLGSVAVSSLSQDLLKKHWEHLFHQRNDKDGNRLKDIDMQFLLKGDRQFFCLH